MSDAAKPGMNPGELVFDPNTKTIKYEGWKSEQLETLAKASDDAATKLAQKLTGLEGKVNDFIATLPEADRVNAASITNGLKKEKLEALANNVSDASRSKLLEFLKTNAGAEFEAATEAASKAIPAALEAGKIKLDLLKKVDIKTIKGYTPENEEVIKSAVQAAIKEGEALQKEIGNMASYFSASAAAKGAGTAAQAAAETEGFFASRWGGAGFGRIKDNFFTGSTWKEAPVKTGFKAGGTVVGVGMIVDAAVRSQKPGDDGRPTDRSGGMRAAEAVIGAALAAGSALHR
jgi:hypothetical protein